MVLPGETVGSAHGVTCDCGKHLTLKVLSSAAGHYLGYFCPECGPFSRETGYFSSQKDAETEYMKWLAGVEPDTLRSSFSAMCSVSNTPFYGEIVIEYYPAYRLLEFISFEQWLHEQATTITTVEGICRLVFDKLVEVLGEVPIRVTIHARTTVHGPASVRISSERWYEKEA